MRCRECSAELPAEARFCLSCGARVETVASAPPGDPLLQALDAAIGFQYRIERLLGRGGMGAVYLAHELALERDVAIKVLPPEKAGASTLRDRFLREARTAARLSHPNIVPLHTFGEVSGLLYFVMGYVRGESLGARLQREGPLDPEAARTLLAGVCDALAYAHGRGIVHRDIKPDNILIDAASGAPLLTDFGIAKRPLSDAALTMAGQIIGTPYYMSPEQAMGRTDVGPTSDLYSLGVVAYEMVSGRRPFDGESPMDVLTRRLTSEPRPLASIATHLPSDLAEAIHRCLRSDPANRWPDAKSLREALLPTEDEPDFSPPVRILQTMGTVVLPLAILALGYTRVVAALVPPSPSLSRVTGLLAIVAATLLAASVVAAARLRLGGLGAATILRKALQQPTWWRSWYPRALRRRGDVWDLLPGTLRRYRTFKGAILAYVWGVFVPLSFIALWEHRLPALRGALFAAALIGLPVMFLLRRRAIGEMCARAGGTWAEAPAILNAPTWRLSVWRRAPAASVLGATPRPAVPSSVDDEETRLAGAPEDERPTKA